MRQYYKEYEDSTKQKEIGIILVFSQNNIPTTDVGLTQKQVQAIYLMMHARPDDISPWVDEISLAYLLTRCEPVSEEEALSKVPAAQMMKKITEWGAANPYEDPIAI